MKNINFRGAEAVEIQTNMPILNALLAKQIDVMMLCDGRGMCATCHVYVTRNPHCLTPITEREKKTLALLSGAQSNSRLACQAHVIAEGVEIALPEGLYLESTSSLESLIGKRTQVPILHPIDGRILIESGKIITRSSIMQLKDVDFDIKKVQAT